MPAELESMSPDRDTIFALSSGRPPAAIAVIRISGPHAALALDKLVGRVPDPRRATLARVRDPAGGAVIDEGLALWFPAPNSETGEDLAELQVHGGRAVIAAVLAALGRLEGFRPAEAGEFTRRAFENGRLDLTAVEGLADLVAAETEAQRRQAFLHLKGMLGERAESWRKRLIEALALVEAAIDFSDEGDIPKQTMEQALALIGPLSDEINRAGAGQGERLREGLRIAIAGPPNAGKSTLFNRLARREAAIVSPYPGTTRDVLEVHLDLGGFPVTVLDTAGIRDTDDPVEREGVRRAGDQAARADLVLWVVDATSVGAEAMTRGAGVPEHPSHSPVWVVVNKIDLISEATKERTESQFSRELTVHFLSSQTGAGIEEMVNALARHAECFFTPEPALVTRQRQRAHLHETLRAIREAEQAAKAGCGDEIVAENLRLATRALGKLLGRVDVEDILDVIFREFCIGK
jgi:tRNA modification GTPase